MRLEEARFWALLLYTCKSCSYLFVSVVLEREGVSALRILYWVAFVVWL